jgi:hypothetical protein
MQLFALFGLYGSKQGMIGETLLVDDSEAKPLCILQLEYSSLPTTDLYARLRPKITVSYKPKRF